MADEAIKEVQMEEVEDGVTVVTLKKDQLVEQLRGVMRQLMLAERGLTRIAQQMEELRSQQEQIRRQAQFLTGQLEAYRSLLPQDEVNDIQRKLYQELERELSQQQEAQQEEPQA